MRKINIKFVLGVVGCIGLLFGNADAYDLRTHGRISDESFRASYGVARYLNDMRINPADDIFDPQTITLPYQLAEFENDARVRGWMIEGTIREASSITSSAASSSWRSPRTLPIRGRRH